MQIPAVELEVPLTLRQRQDVQPAVDIADAAQQHFPRQRLLPQSNGDEHDSPGLERRQEPKGGAQDEHPNAADAFEQQYPPRHAMLGHDEFAEHAEPPETLMQEPWVESGILPRGQAAQLLAPDEAY